MLPLKSAASIIEFTTSLVTRLTNYLLGTGKWGSTIGGRAVAVPLELKGLEQAHKMYGKLSWDVLVQPAIELAENGFEAHRYLVRALARSNLAPVSFLIAYFI